MPGKKHGPTRVESLDTVTDQPRRWHFDVEGHAWTNTDWWVHEHVHEAWWRLGQRILWPGTMRSIARQGRRSTSELMFGRRSTAAAVGTHARCTGCSLRAAGAQLFGTPAATVTSALRAAQAQPVGLARVFK